eukprot:764091-Hanusia_phi.AAC.11
MAFYRNASKCSSDQRRTYFKIIDPRGRSEYRVLVAWTIERASEFGLNISQEEPLRTFLLPLGKQHGKGQQMLDLDKTCKQACIGENEVFYVNETIEHVDSEVGKKGID